MEASTLLGVQVEEVIRVAQEAGRLVLEMQRRGLHGVRSKSSAIDLVTEADVAAEAQIRAGLQELAPAAGFWGEESDTRPTQEFFWLVDPIDGTTNYANSIPLFAVNIALNRGEETLLGVTLELPSGRIFWAERGRGAFLRTPDGQEQRLQVNQVERLEQAVLTTGFPYSRAHHPDNNSREFTAFMVQSAGVRCMGSAALELAYVAAGYTTAHWEAGPKAWDVAPGLLLIQEAGGRVTTYSGGPRRLDSRTILASNGQPALHQALLATLQEVRQTLPERLFQE